MNRELFLIRHAQAEFPEYNQKDKERSLTAQGSQDAMRLGNLLLNNKLQPDYILCSTALRTRQTAGYICEQIEFDSNKINLLEDIYESSVRILLNTINNISDSYQRVYIVAHNPSISYLAEYITGDVIGDISPAGTVHIQLGGMSWAMLSQNNASLLKYYDPIDL